MLSAIKCFQPLTNGNPFQSSADIFISFLYAVEMHEKL